MDRLPARRRNANPHARGDNQGVFAILLQFNRHVSWPMLKHRGAGNTRENWQGNAWIGNQTEDCSPSITLIKKAFFSEGLQ
jgi:hypothetical protein